MKLEVTLIISLCFGGIVNGQKFDSSAYKFAKEIKSETLREHLEVIASDEYEGRETGKEGQKMTMEYLINEFKSYGIEDIDGLNYRQPFPLIEQENKNLYLSIAGEEFIMFEDFIVNPQFVANQDIAGDINLFTSKEEELENKSFFVWSSEELKEDEEYSQRLKELKKNKAGIAFYYNPKLSASLEKYEHYYKKSKTKLESELKDQQRLTISFSDKGFEKLLSIVDLDKEKVEKKGLRVLDKAFPLAFELNIDKPNHRLIGENVLAYIEGEEYPDEVIVITAHYDHLGKNDSLVFNGADDDGSGTVSLLEIAQSFVLAKEAGIGPKRSILIMPVSGEEKGLLGSKYYSENPVFPLENTVANLNIDMIGRYDKKHKDDSNYVYLIGSDKLSTDLHELSETVNETYSNFNLDYRYNKEDDPNRFYYRSDHYNFARNNVPVIFYFSGVHEDYHRSTDTIEKIDFDKTARIARLVFYTAWELANRQERIKLKEEF